MRLAALLATLVATLVLALLTTAPGATSAAQEEKKKEAAQAEETVPIVIPEEEKNRKNPAPPTPESLEMGKKLFGYQCSMCHGAKGDGQGDLAQEMKWAMPDFTNPELRKKRTDGELHYILTEGHGHMPGQKTRLRPEQKWNMINFIRTLAAKKAPETEEKN